MGCLLLGLSSLLTQGTGLVLLALLPMALAQAAFCQRQRSSHRETPFEHRGLAMALFRNASLSVLLPLLSLQGQSSISRAMA